MGGTLDYIELNNALLDYMAARHTKTRREWLAPDKVGEVRLEKYEPPTSVLFIDSGKDMLRACKSPLRDLREFFASGIDAFAMKFPRTFEERRRAERRSDRRKQEYQLLATIDLNLRYL